MKGLRFESGAALASALGAGLIPEEIACGAVEYWREQPGARDGAVIVDASALPAKAYKALVELGVGKVGEGRGEHGTAPFWPAVLRPEPVRDPHEDVVLFRADEGEAALDLATELLVLGSERVELATFAHGALLRAFRPSHYVVLRACEPESRVRAFAPAAPGNDSVFVELGWRQPLMAKVAAAPGELLLCARSGAVEAVRPGGFRPIWDHLVLTAPQRASDAAAIVLAKRRVPLRLARAVTPRVATLWVLREGGVAAIDRLVESAPEEIVRALSFAAWGEHDRPTVLLSSSQPIPLYLDAEAYAAHPELPDVFVPIDRRVHPPVWSDRLRAAVGGPDDRLRWLVPTETGLCVESVLISRLSPLIDWVELVVQEREVEPWLRAVAFEPKAFDVLFGVPSATRAKREREDKIEPEPRSRRTPRGPAVPIPAPAPVPPPVPQARPRAPARAASTLAATESGAEAALRELELSFRAVLAPLAAPERDAEWLALSRAYAAARLGRDAAVCRARLVFDGSPHAAEVLGEWLAAGGTAPAQLVATVEAGLAGEPKGDAMYGLVGALAALAAIRAAAPPSTRAGAPVSVRTGAPAGELTAETIARAFDRLIEGGELLCVRSMWIGMRSIVTLSGDDDLALARARDQIFARLEGGLSLSRDLPRVVRSFDDGASDRRRVLSDLLRFFETTTRAKSPVEAPVAATLAYVRLVLAIALARTGEAERAQALLGDARQKLDEKDPVHGALLAWFGARVGQALEGDPESAPLPLAVLALRDKLDRLQQYKLDRVRQSVKLLEPDTDLDPFRSFGMGGGDAKSELLRRVHAAKHAREMAAVIDAAWSGAVASDAADRADRAGALLAAMAACPVRVAAARLGSVADLVEGASPEVAIRILMQALPLAERFETAEATDKILGLLEARLRDLDGSKIAEIAPRIARGAQVIRHHEANAPFAAALRALVGRLVAPDAGSAIGRLALWRALAVMGDGDGAAAVFAAERALLERQLAPAQRLALIRALAATAIAIGRVEDVVALTSEWAKTTDSYNTNSHLCLSAVELADAIASALVPQRGDAIGKARRLADEDEWYARARVLSEGEDSE